VLLLFVNCSFNKYRIHQNLNACSKDLNVILVAYPYIHVAAKKLRTKSIAKRISLHFRQASNGGAARLPAWLCFWRLHWCFDAD